MATSKAIDIINSNNADKRQDNFYIRFFQFKENVSNFLGKQVQTISRPDISFQVIQNQHKGNQYTDHGFLRFEPISITFADDENSLTSMLLYSQLMRQKKKYKGEVEDLVADDYHSKTKFSIEYKFFNSRDEAVETFVLYNCFITSIRHTEPLMSSDQGHTITVGLQYDNIDVQVFDRFISLT